MSPETISRGVRAYFAAIGAMDSEAWVATFATDATSYDPVGAPPTVGHDGLRHRQKLLVDLPQLAWVAD